MPLSRSRRMRLAAILLAAVSVLALPLLAGAQDDHAPAPEAAHGADAGHGEAAGGEHGGPGIGAELSLLWVIPFVGILLSIALGPIIDHHWWEHNYPKASLAWALAFSVPFCVIYGMKGSLAVATHEILHIYLVDYIPFIILLTGLFVAAGGIVLRGTLVGTPGVNAGFIAVGSVLASIIGTTGASMLLIRPLLRANKHRQHRVHIVVIFIFLVSNIGGALTPLGDPPLFLGFLHGVPFQWTLSLAPQMATVIVLVLLVFVALDRWYLSREANPVPDDDGDAQPLAVAGAHNFLFLLGIMGAVLLSGLWRPGDVTVLGVHVSASSLVRDGLILLIAVGAFAATKQTLRDENEFEWEPIKEVGILFAGIFMTIIPALAILKAGEEGALALVIRMANSEVAYMWLAGILSSFLDNAPTYLTFFNTALGKLHLTEAVVSDYLASSPLPWMNVAAVDASVAAGIQERHPEVASMSVEALQTSLQQFGGFLKAISMGAVFMGANTYIGNAPNFMVRSIAIQDGVKMPSFFGFMAWSCAILIPIFVVVTLLFLVLI